jgi:hypothetical protein
MPIDSTACALIIVLVAMSVLSVSASAFSVVPTSSRVARVREFGPCPLTFSSQDVNNNNNNVNEDERQWLLEKARQLREEVRNLEEKVRATKSDLPAALEGDSQKTTAHQPKVTNLKDSTWTISYRFSSQPKDDDKDSSILPNYSGKFNLLLKADGYSELLSQQSTAITNDQKLQITKVWGWDEEYSQQDQKNYLLFSMDVQLPASDPKLPSVKERYYFQAQINKSGSDGEISLKDGTVTVKKDITEKTKGRWGLFQVAGILSQFRYVGDFAAKSSS